MTSGPPPSPQPSPASGRGILETVLKLLIYHCPALAGRKKPPTIKSNDLDLIGQ